MILIKRFITPLFFLSLIASISCSEDVTPTEEIQENEDIPIEFNLEIAFAKSLGGSNIDEGEAIIQANDGGFVILGATKSTDGDITDKTIDDTDVWIVKTDPQGSIQWSKTYGGSDNDFGTNIKKTNDGGYIISAVTRSSDGDISTNAGFNDMWVFKISSSGNIIWEKTYGYAGNDLAYNVILTSDGGYLLLGVLDVSASNGEGNVGRINSNHAGGDYWVLKLDSSGEREWSRYYGGTFTDTAYDAIETPSGGFIITGSSDSEDVDINSNIGEYDFWILNINESGDIIWRKNFGGSEIDLVYAMTKTIDGNYLLVGDTRSSDIDIEDPLGNADVWAVKFSESGSIIWTKTYGGTQFESARDVVSLSDGTIAIVSSSRSNDINLTNNYGVNDAWLLLIDNDGKMLSQKNIGGSNLDFGRGITQTIDGNLIITGNTESADGDLNSNKGNYDLLLVKVEKQTN
ncbi:lipoprotein [Patiriisocius marinistellae]|uniref:Lipoprotein n=1 Tax=Patiriisocius marinistellae TaxID=2494560 RepID=A0A5J4FX83_9FLAO|nr:hypothetical protein [Patiriisocius marinistellae]GEQ84689.1 lipoprotein [Patiriisocius marinistellae]